MAKDEEKYYWAVMNGKREKVGNFRVEPPSLFRGRGEHPKMGRIKKRIQPEDVTINIGREAKVPEPPAGHRWKEVIHNQYVTWLAGWKDSVNTKVRKMSFFEKQKSVLWLIFHISFHCYRTGSTCSLAPRRA